VPVIKLNEDIHSLSDFKRKTNELVDQIEQTGRPVVLTVHGKARLVVQDAGSYQKLLDSLDQAEALAGIRRGLEDIAAGRTQSVDEAFDDIRRRAKAGRRKKK
jgi:prevent-host-death family protein